MKKNNVIIGIFIFICFVFSCKKIDFEQPNYTQGSADFTRYIAVSNSLTQGYQDGGLYEQGQNYSYPSIIAQQMKLVNPDMEDFIQPVAKGNGSGYLHLEYIDGEFKVIDPASDTVYGKGYEEDPSWTNWENEVKGKDYNNLGITGIRLIECVARNNNEQFINNAILNYNPYARFLDFNFNTSYLYYVKQSKPTFFTCWLGNNDVLGFATSGGDETIIYIPFFGNIKRTPLSDPDEFKVKYDSVLAALTANGAKGVCATIPDVTNIPFFTTVTPELMEIDTIWITDNTGNIRPYQEGDYILLSSLKKIKDDSVGYTKDNALGKNDVLDYDEAEQVKVHTVMLNNIIKEIAGKYNVPVVDMYNFLKTVKSGITINGIDLTVEFIEGGAFSLDGVHPNPKGYAMVANEFIRVINENFGSNIPPVDVGKYRSVIFP